MTFGFAAELGCHLGLESRRKGLLYLCIYLIYTHMGIKAGIAVLIYSSASRKLSIKGKARDWHWE